MTTDATQTGYRYSYVPQIIESMDTDTKQACLLIEDIK